MEIRTKIVAISIIIFLSIISWLIWYNAGYCNLLPKESFMCFGQCSHPQRECFQKAAESDINFKCHRTAKIILNNLVDPNYINYEYSSEAIKGYFNSEPLDNCFQNLFTKEDSPNICLDYKDPVASKHCITQLALYKKDPNICNLFPNIWTTNTKNDLISSYTCITNSGGGVSQNYCENLKGNLDQKLCYARIAKKMNQNCELILTFNYTSSADRDIDYVECVYQNAQEEENIDLCFSCINKTGYCDVSKCFLNYGLTKGNISSCFYNNYLLSFNYTSIYDPFLDCYWMFAQSSSTPFKEKCDSVGYLKNYCENISIIPLKDNCLSNYQSLKSITNC